MVRMLLAAGAAVDARSTDDRTPLMDAAALCRPDVMRELLQAGADISAKSSAGCCALTYVLMGTGVGPRSPRLEISIAAGAAITNLDIYGSTALHYAAIRQKPDAVQALLAAGAEVDPRDNSGRTPLWFTMMQLGEQCTAPLLLAAGAAVGAGCGRYGTPLMYVAAAATAAAAGGASKPASALIFDMCMEHLRPAHAPAAAAAAQPGCVPAYLLQAACCAARVLVPLCAHNSNDRKPISKPAAVIRRLLLVAAAASTESTCSPVDSSSSSNRALLAEGEQGALRPKLSGRARLAKSSQCAMGRSPFAAASEALQMAMQQELPSKLTRIYHLKSTPSQAAGNIACVLLELWIEATTEAAALEAQQTTTVQQMFVSVAQIQQQQQQQQQQQAGWCVPAA